MTNETTASQPTPHQNTLDAITGAIAYGRQGTNPPPSPEHWLAEYWSIGQQLAELGKTSAWDNVTPTASQPKSIGDDAQFQALLCGVWLDKTGEAVPALVAYIHEYFRAPAAQASATIQAAPELLNTERLGLLISYVSVANRRDGWAAENSYFGSEDLARAAKAVENAERNLLEYVKSIAATIQEPVMVAELVGEVKASEADLEVRQQVTEALGLGRVSNASFTWSYLMGCIKDAVELAASTTPAAPMVADPAGVAVHAKVECYFFDTEDVRLVLTDRNDKREIRMQNDDAWFIVNAIAAAKSAATVKAVPSEALDAAPEIIGWYRDEQIDANSDSQGLPERLIPHRALTKGASRPRGDGWKAVVEFAAPLADKTGGGK